MTGENKYPDDRWSKHAKRHETYWKCACGLARVKADAMFDHLKEENDDTSHFAYFINTTNTDVEQNGKMIYFQNRS